MKPKDEHNEKVAGKLKPKIKIKKYIRKQKKVPRWNSRATCGLFAERERKDRRTVARSCARACPIKRPRFIYLFVIPLHNVHVQRRHNLHVTNVYPMTFHRGCETPRISRDNLTDESLLYTLKFISIILINQKLIYFDIYISIIHLQ